MSDQTFDEWAIVELFGHRKLAGRVTESQLAGGSFLRLDVPGEDGDVATQYINPRSVYAITPTTEALARETARGCILAPVTRYELPAQVDERF